MTKIYAKRWNVYYHKNQNNESDNTVELRGILLGLIEGHDDANIPRTLFILRCTLFKSYA